MSQTYLHTLNGTIVLENLPTWSMTPTAIGDVIAKIPRFAGRTAEPYSVAAHSVLVSRLCSRPEDRAWALLHDAHEAFIGDLITPAVVLIGAQSVPVGKAVVENGVKAAKDLLDRQILASWRLAGRHDGGEVAYFDHVAYLAERATFFDVVEPDTSAEHQDVERAIEIMRGLPQSSNWRAARDLWLSEVEHLTSLQLMNPPTETQAA